MTNDPDILKVSVILSGPLKLTSVSKSTTLQNVTGWTNTALSKNLAGPANIASLQKVALLSKKKLPFANVLLKKNTSSVDVTGTVIRRGFVNTTSSANVTLFENVASSRKDTFDPNDTGAEKEAVD
jgi:hypothetical protein